jgi:hypothetical protein
VQLSGLCSRVTCMKASIMPVAVTMKDLGPEKRVWNISVQTPEDKVGWSTWEPAIAKALEERLNQLVEVEYAEKTNAGGWLNRFIQSIPGVVEKKKSYGGGKVDLSPLLEEMKRQTVQLAKIAELLAARP